MTRSKSESQLAEAYRWANREGGRVSGQCARVLVELLTYVDLETRVAYPKRVTLARNIYDTETPSKTQLNAVSEALTKLENAELVRREQSFHEGRLSVNVYFVRVGERARTVPGKSRHCKPGSTGHSKPGSTGHREPGFTGHLKYPVEVSREVSREEAPEGAPRHLKVVN